MAMYNEMFPPHGMYMRSRDILPDYERVHAPDAHPCFVASYLLLLAISASQPVHQDWPWLQDVKDGMLFNSTVSTLVEETIVVNDDVCGTSEGIAVTLLYIRLLLVRAKIKKCWLLFRHLIALAEMIGLPQMAAATPLPTESNTPLGKQETAAALWHVMCTNDRMAAMLMNLPAATARHILPKPPTVMSEGKVISHAFMEHLATIALSIVELDHMTVSQLDESIILAKVSDIDTNLRQLVDDTPPSWWVDLPGMVSITHTMQIWHQYFTVRAHLNLATKRNTNGQYGYSRRMCTSASREVARRYVKIRGMFPPGFYAGRLVDLQALVATMALVHCIFGTRAWSSEVTAIQEGDREDLNLIVQATQAMHTAGEQLSGEVAREGSKALQLLLSHLQDSPTGTRSLVLEVPMMGKLTVARTATKTATAPAPRHDPEDAQSLIPGATDSDTTSESDARVDRVHEQIYALGLSLLNTSDWDIELSPIGSPSAEDVMDKLADAEP